MIIIMTVGVRIMVVMMVVAVSMMPVIMVVMVVAVIIMSVIMVVMVCHIIGLPFSKMSNQNIPVAEKSGFCSSSALTFAEDMI